jgi:hypothetical protein
MLIEAQEESKVDDDDRKIDNLSAVNQMNEKDNSNSNSALALPQSSSQFLRLEMVKIINQMAHHANEFASLRLQLLSTLTQAKGRMDSDSVQSIAQQMMFATNKAQLCHDAIACMRHRLFLEQLHHAHFVEEQLVKAQQQHQHSVDASLSLVTPKLRMHQIDLQTPSDAANNHSATPRPSIHSRSMTDRIKVTLSHTHESINQHRLKTASITTMPLVRNAASKELPLLNWPTQPSVDSNVVEYSI